MSRPDASIDPRILESAKNEFLTYGYEKASTNRICKNACVTSGALYKRFAGKDELFCSLISDLMSLIAERTTHVAEHYETAKKTRSADDFSAAMEYEKRCYIELLFEYYEKCTLFFCKSDGSSVERMLSAMMKKKTEVTAAFLQSIAKKTVDTNAIQILMSTQFYFYRQLLDSGMEKDAAVACMETVEKYNEAGWRRIFEDLEVG